MKVKDLINTLSSNNINVWIKSTARELPLDYFYNEYRETDIWQQEIESINTVVKGKTVTFELELK